MLRTLGLVFILIAAQILTASAAAVAAPFTFTLIDPPDPGRETRAQDINNHGVIVGFFEVPPGCLPTCRGYRRDPVSHIFEVINFQHPTTLQTAVSTQALGINDGDSIVGNFNFSDQVEHGFVRKSGSFAQIDVPGATATSAIGINAAETIVGQFFDGVGHGFRLVGADFSAPDVGATGTLTALDVPGATRTGARGINDPGDIAGFFEDAARRHGFLVPANTSTFEEIIVPGATLVDASGINNDGAIVGRFEVVASPMAS